LKESDLNPVPTLEQRVERLEEDLKLMNRELQRRNQELMGVFTILCLPMSTSRKMEVGFSILIRLPEDVLKLITDRYLKEAARSDLTFDQIVEPMVKAWGFEKAWSVVTAEKIREQFGEWALGRWLEMSKTHGCEK
jgi:hypothetical protein